MAIVQPDDYPGRHGASRIVRNDEREGVTVLYKMSVDMPVGFLFWRRNVTRYWVINAYWLSHSRIFCQPWEIAGPYFHNKLLPQFDFVREISESDFFASALPVFDGYDDLPLTEVRDANVYGDVVGPR